MNLNTATHLIALAMAPTLSHGFHVVSNPVATRVSTSLGARRSMLPILRRSDPFFSDIDRVFDEMDEMMDQSLAMRFPRPSLSLMDKVMPGQLDVRRLQGFQVKQDENQYTVALHLPNIEAKDIDLQLDNDGRVVRLKGDMIHEDSGMKVQSRFEKAFVLAPDVDTTKLSASMSGGTLTIVAPKIENEAIDNTKSNKVEEPKAVMEEGVKSTDDLQKATTRLAVENLKDQKAKAKQTETMASGEKRWPARDFPY